MGNGILVTKTDTETTFNDRNEPVENIRVAFKVDDDGPFYKRFPKDGFNGSAAMIELETFARELRALKG